MASAGEYKAKHIMATSTTALERKLPQNTEAERSILGAILLDNQRAQRDARKAEARKISFTIITGASTNR